MHLSAFFTRMVLFVVGWTLGVAQLIAVIQLSVSLEATNPILSLFATITASLVTALVMGIGVLALMWQR
jgi:hypothetical protein